MRQQCQPTSDQTRHRFLDHRADGSRTETQFCRLAWETWKPCNLAAGQLATGNRQEFMPFWACKCSHNWRRVILIAIWAFVCTFMRSNCPCKSTSTSTRTRCIWRMQLVSCLEIAVTSITRAKHFWVKTLWRFSVFFFRWTSGSVRRSCAHKTSPLTGREWKPEEELNWSIGSLYALAVTKLV